MIAFLGMGLLGSNFVKALLKKGEQVQVWNRTAARATALETFGAKAFVDATVAVKGASRIHLTLSEDKSVDETLEKACAGFTPGVIIIDHSTTRDSSTTKDSSTILPNHVYYLDPEQEPLEVVDSKELTRRKRATNAAAEASSDEDIELSAYEKMRAERVSRNADRLKALGLA